VATVLDMSMSLDGFVAGPNTGPGNGLGDGGERLHEWLEIGSGGHEDVGLQAGVNRQVFDELMATGAVVAGRGTFEPAGGWNGDHHDGVPIFIVARDELGIDVSDWPLVSVVPDVATALGEANRAAGEKDVLVHGAAEITRLALAAGMLDWISIHLVPILLGGGRRLIDVIDGGQVDLQRVQVLEGENGVTHLRYRVEKRL